MKAVVCTAYGPPEVLKMREIEKPVPKDNEVLIKVMATSVTAADYIVRGFALPTSFWLPGRMMLGFTRPRRSILGMEISGVIEAVGKDVQSFKVGDEVFAATLQSFGGYAEYKCMPENSTIALKPANMTFEEAAVVPIGARTALYYLDMGKLKAGQKILIYGASGSVGTYAVQLAKSRGAKVTGVCSTGNLDMVKALGADKVIDYTITNFTDQFETYDMVFVTIDKCPFKACYDALEKYGFYANIGRPLKSLPMMWASLTGNRQIVVGKTAPETVEALNTLKQLIEKGQLKAEIDRHYNLDKVVDAHRYAEQGHKKGNVAIRVQAFEG